MKTLRDVMRPSFLITVQQDTVVMEAVHAMARHNVGIVVVLEGEALVGLFSERDVVQRVVSRGLDPRHTAITDVMTRELVIGDADEDCSSAMRKMNQANIRHLPVVSGTRLLSMLSIRDLMRVDLADKGQELEYLRAYLYQIPSQMAPDPA
jgi:CBS domain-containing protein